jgi:hypothetical protein
VPVERIELPTFGLQNRCSTAELNRHLGSDKTLLYRRYQPQPDLVAGSGGQIAELPRRGHRRDAD